MAFNKNPIRFFFSIAVLAWTFLPAHAQNQQSTTDQASRQEKQNSATYDSKPANETQELEKKIDKLQSLLEQQQRILLELQNRVMELEGKPRVAATTPLVILPTPAASTTASTPTETRAVAKENGPDAKNLAASPAAQNPSKAQDSSVGVAGWDNTSAYIRSADGSFETRVTGFAQFDFRGYQSGEHPPNSYAVRRARMRLEGTIDRYFEWRVEGEMADTTSILLRDFYVRLNRAEEAQLTVGQFREPFSQEELRPEPSQDFVEKSLVNLLAPSRSPGIMLSGVINKGVFEYQVGSFNGKGMLRDNSNGTPESAFRVRFAPWKNGTEFWLKGLAFGGAYAQGRNIRSSSLRGQTSSRSFTFFTPENVNGKIIRANGEMTWLLGPAVLRAEFDQTNQAKDNLGPGGTHLPGIVAKGYAAQFTYMLTGETKSDTGATTPKHNLFSRENGRMGFGAFEFKARFDDLQIANGTAKTNRSQSLYVGSNWYMNRFVKHMLDFGFERFNDPVRSPKPGDKNFFVVQSRIQIAF
jgi:phosphate-selective porin OprO and OprP